MPRPKRSGRAAAKKKPAKSRSKGGAKGAAKRGSAKKKATSNRGAMRDEALQQVVDSEMPEMQIEEKRKGAKAARRPPNPGPSLNDFRRKYLGEEAGAAYEQDAAVDDEGIEVRQVRSKKSPADPADDPGPRTVILKKKKIIGAQG